MGFYIRKGFNFGPIRLNLSRSGLGASVGVKGARVGMGPHGSYVHLGRGGFYYRKSLNLDIPRPNASKAEVPVRLDEDNLEDISSADATSIADASASELLRELNRIKRRFDVFPAIFIAGSVLLLLTLANGFAWWIGAAALVGIAMLAISARHHDVTTGTVVLNYSLSQRAETEFSKLQVALQNLAGCQRFWHLDSSGFTTDWKRNAGASALVRKSDAEALLMAPPKIVCNLTVPTLKSKKKALYFFPDRLLVYDTTGVGAVPYSDIQSTSGQTRFIEDGYVPSDSTRVGTTWRYVSKNGGPDRRFKNNRQIPIVLYGVLGLSSSSGLTEIFQCSRPEVPGEFAAQISAFGRNVHSDTTYLAEGIGEVSFETPSRTHTRLTGATLWVAVGLMTLTSLVLISRLNPFPASPNEAATQSQSARNQFASSLSQILAARLQSGVAVSAVNEQLSFRFVNIGPKAARRDGLTPFNKILFFERFVAPNSEADLCRLGFKALEISVDSGPATVQPIVCTVVSDSDASSTPQ